MKKVFILLWVCMTVTQTQAQLIFDTTIISTVGSGIKLMLINENSQPWAIQVLEIDLKNPYVTVETVKAKDRLVGLEKTSSMAKRKDSLEHKVIGAINGDFFGGTGIPINAQVCNGEILRLPSGLSTLGFDNKNKPSIHRSAFNGKVITHSESLNIQNLNSARNANQLILYNSYMGVSTGTNAYGTELQLRPLSGWEVNDTLRCVVTKKETGLGNMSIPKNLAVLSGNGTAADFINNWVKLNDTIGLLLELSYYPNHLVQVMGAYPQIIKNGKNYVDEGFTEEGGPNHTYERHPRTAIGFSADSTKLFLVTVDGRQTMSKGMTLNELANFMLQIGVSHGVNFDGGGSTTMVVNHQIINSPSDVSGERSVSNGLLAISSAPTGSLQKIKISPHKLQLKLGSQKLFTVSAYNQYDNILPMDSTLIQWKTSPGLGNISANGWFKANQTPTDGYIQVTYNSFTDSIPVQVIAIGEIFLTPNTMTTDSILPVKIHASAQNENTTFFEILPEIIQWSVSNSEIGAVTQEGIFTGIKNGTTQVIASVGNVQGIAEITVVITHGTIILDSMEAPETWILTKEFMDSIQLQVSTSIATEGLGSMFVDYWFTYMGRIPSFTLAKRIPLEAFPDSIWLDAKFDGKDQRVSYKISTSTNVQFLTYSPIINQLQFKPTGAEIPVKPLEDYPLTLESVKVEFMKNPDWIQNQVYQGNLFIDNLRVSYPGFSPIVGIKEKMNEHSIVGLIVHPNPVNEVIQISFELKNPEPVIISIYDAIGSLLSKTILNEGLPSNTLHTQIDCSKLEPGIYILQLSVGCETFERKIIVF